MQVDDLTVGDVVQIQRWHPSIMYVVNEVGQQQAQEFEDHSYAGAPLRVLNISLPFIVVKNLLCPLGPFHLDTRKFVLGSVSNDYVVALIGKEG